MKEILISVNPPYAKMIMDGSKPMEFRKQILKDLKVTGLQDVKAYIYETQNKKGQGAVIGEVMIVQCYFPEYEKERNQMIPPNVVERFSMIKNLYYLWCERKGIQPNPKEGWFKSKKFQKYRNEIGMDPLNFNYALVLDYPVLYQTPISLGNFTNNTGNPLKRSPQNMCYCKKTIFDI